MDITIKRVSRKYGLSRYRISMRQGIPVEFVIQTKPRFGPVREWYAAFARSIEAALVSWRRLNYPEGESK